MVHSGVVGFFAFLTLAACVPTLVPSLFWGVNGNLKYSLWQRCDITGCHKFTFSKDDFSNEITAERDAAIAGMILGALFAILTLLASACRSRCFAIFTTVLMFIFTLATVGCLARLGYTMDLHISTSFFIACGACFLALISSICSCCMTTASRNSYSYV